MNELARVYEMIMADLLPATLVVGEDRRLLHVFGDAYPRAADTSAADAAVLEGLLAPLLDAAMSGREAAQRITLEVSSGGGSKTVEVSVRLSPANAGHDALFIVDIAAGRRSHRASKTPRPRRGTPPTPKRPDRRPRPARSFEEAERLEGHERIRVVLDGELQRARRLGTRLSAALIELDGFIELSRKRGRVVSQSILRQVGMRLNSVVRPIDTVDQIGPKDFLAILVGTRRAEAAIVAERITNVIADTPFDVHGESIAARARVGLTQIDVEHDRLDAVLTHARYDLMQAQRSRQPSSPNPPTTIADVIAQQGGLRPMVMPIRELASDRVVGHELLIRGPEGPYELPDDLFRAGSEQNVLSRVDLACLRTCLEAAERLPDGNTVHINVFPSTLIDGTADENPLLTGGRALDDVCVEISEQQLVGDPSYLCPHIDRMREAGATLALDDVGFRRSSLESLIVLEPEVVKIDRTVISCLDEGPGPRRALERLIGVTEHMDCRVIAEGVETESTRDTLIELGVEFAQGFLWGRPAPA